MSEQKAPYPKKDCPFKTPADGTACDETCAIYSQATMECGILGINTVLWEIHGILHNMMNRMPM